LRSDAITDLKVTRLWRRNRGERLRHSCPQACLCLASAGFGLQALVILLPPALDLARQPEVFFERGVTDSRGY